jgi:hypothetical protein
MKALLLNTFLGICLGRFASIWACAVFVPLVVAEVAYGVLVHDLSASACLRRGTTLLITAEFAFLFGALLRPMRDEAA